MVVVLVSGPDANPVVEAFQEEASILVRDATAPVSDLAADVLRCAPAQVIAADLGSVAAAEMLRREAGIASSIDGDPAALFDRSVQSTRIGSGWAPPAGETTSAVAAPRGTVSLRPRTIGSGDGEIIVGRPGQAAPHPGAHVVRPSDGGRRCVVDLVSLGGRHVVSDVAMLRVAERNGALHVRHRISLLDHDDEAKAAEAAGRAALDALGYRNGACQVELEERYGWQAVEVRCAPCGDGPGVDAAFRAFGYSHMHLLCESLIRPSEFERRVSRPPQRRRTHLASAFVRCWPEHLREGANGLRLLRRLTGFHSVGPLYTRSDGLVGCVACFVHEDRDFIENSLRVVHEMEDSGSFYARQGDFFAYAPRLAGQSW